MDHLQADHSPPDQSRNSYNPQPSPGKKSSTAPGTPAVDRIGADGEPSKVCSKGATSYPPKDAITGWKAFVDLLHRPGEQAHASSSQSSEASGKRASRRARWKETSRRPPENSFGG